MTNEQFAVIVQLLKHILAELKKLNKYAEDSQ